MKTQQINLSAVTETKKITSSCSSNSSIDNTLNTYLKLGWRIIDQWIVGHGDPRERFETLHVLLGWFDSETQAPYPTQQ